MASFGSHSVLKIVWDVYEISVRQVIFLVHHSLSIQFVQISFGLNTRKKKENKKLNVNFSIKMAFRNFSFRIFSRIIDDINMKMLLEEIHQSSPLKFY